MQDLVLDRDYFDSEESVINHVRDKGLERPAPMATMVRCVTVRAEGAVIRGGFMSCRAWSLTRDAARAIVPVY